MTPALTFDALDEAYEGTAADIHEFCDQAYTTAFRAQEAGEPLDEEAQAVVFALAAFQAASVLVHRAGMSVAAAADLFLPEDGEPPTLTLSLEDGSLKIHFDWPDREPVAIDTDTTYEEVTP